MRKGTIVKIGIIGAENSHTAAIAKLINVEKKIKGFSVDYLWGETEDFAKTAAKEGKIPNIVKKPAEMLGKIDAVIADHRHPKYHLKAVAPFVKKGIPAFVDKPFCYRAEKGREFLKLARQSGAAVTSFSVVPHWNSFRSFLKKLPEIGEVVSAYTWGPCDLKSKWGGVFFYGIHQVDIMLHAFGYDVDAVQVTKNGPGNATGQLFYKSGRIVNMALIKEGAPGFGIAAVGDKGTLTRSLTGGKSPYLNGTRTFCRMFRTGQEPMTDEEMLRPVQVLEAMQQSVRTGAKEKAAR
jgi:predicted dehydrogenase